MTDSFIQVPPQSTGAKLQTKSSTQSGHVVDTQVMILGDRSDPGKQQIVDENGAAYTRFTTGTPNFDAFSLALSSEPNLMGLYKFYEVDEASRFYKNEVGGATIARDSSMGSIKLATGTADGDLAQYFTHRRFCYRPGASITNLFAAKVGDTGKSNVRRRIGYFGDEGEHICFEMDGDQGVYVSWHNALTGITTRVISGAWNGDRMDGLGGETNRSGESLDPDKANLWWVDYQYPGAIRFGTWVNGKQIICHTTQSFNGDDRPFLKSPNLAFGMEQENTGLVGSSSELHGFWASIVSSGFPEHVVKGTGFSHTLTVPDNTFTPIASFRCSQLLDGVDNRFRLLPLIMNGASDTSIIEIKAEIGTVLTGATWAGSTYGIEYDLDATVAVPGPGVDPVLGMFIGTGHAIERDLRGLFPSHVDGFHREWDITAARHMTLSARVMSGASTTFGFNLAMEIRH